MHNNIINGLHNAYYAYYALCKPFYVGKMGKLLFYYFIQGKTELRKNEKSVRNYSFNFHEG